MRDLDFGRQVVDYLQQLDWPDGVVIEDLSCSVPLVLHRLQELRPAKVVLLGAVPRGLDPPATVRRYRLDPTSPPRADVHRTLEEAVTGLTDIDHTLAVARHWGGLPVDTVVVEVEPVEAGFGLGFSEELAACFDPILDMVREEVGGGAGVHRDLEALPPVEPPATDPGPVEPSAAMSELFGYARHHADARRQSHRAPALVGEPSSDVPGVALAGLVRPWGVFADSGGDWFDAIPLEGGRLGIVVGDVAGRGVDVAAAMGDLRAAARAYAVLEGDVPARLVGHLDRLAEATGLGHDARVLYLVVDPGTGDVRFANAGGCPPLVLDAGTPGGRFLDAAQSGPLGAVAGADRPEAALHLTHGSTLLLCTDGLVESRAVSRAVGLQRLRRAAGTGPESLQGLCDHVLRACTGQLRRDDDICLLGVRLLAQAVPAEARPSHRSHR